MYLSQIYAFITDGLLQQNLVGKEGDQARDQMSQLENSVILLLLEQWTILVSLAPKNRPEIGPVHFLAFLTKLLDNVGQPQLKAEGKSQKYVLELTIKIETLVVFMIYSLITQIGENTEMEESASFGLWRMTDVYLSCIKQSLDRDNLSKHKLSQYLPSLNSIDSLDTVLSKFSEYSQIVNHKFEKLVSSDVISLDKLIHSSLFPILY